MRAIDNYTDKEREVLALKGMTAPRTASERGETLTDHVYNHKTMAYEPAPNKAQHSPLPWSADKWATGYTVSATDHSVCHLQDCNNEEANAKLIVRAVNHADKLAEDAKTLAMLALQSTRYTTDADYRDATDAVIAHVQAYEAAQ